MHSHNWIDMCINVPVPSLSDTAALASMVSDSGIFIEDYSDLEELVCEITGVDLIDKKLLELPRDRAAVHLYLPADGNCSEVRRRLEEMLVTAGIDFCITEQPVHESDWENSWKSYYHPFSVSKRLAVCPTWEEFSPLPGQKVIRLDPGMAFGTGAHQTTRLCLSMLELFVKPGDSFLDIGCGSGILSIAATFLGAGQVTGVDIDAVAVRTARDNALQNNLGINFIQGDLDAGILGPFDIVCANIVADVIIRLAPKLPPLLTDRGVCILSGIIESRFEDVQSALLEAGLMPGIVRLSDGWAAVSCGKTIQ